MKIIVTILATAMVLTGSLISSKNTKITATVVNVSGNKGKVSFALYNKTTFMKEPLQAKSAEIIDGKSTVVFEDVEQEYMQLFVCMIKMRIIKWILLQVECH